MEPTKRIYVAGQYERKNVIKQVIEDLKHSGYSITHDWTKTENVMNMNLKESAASDIEGVRQADVLVCIMDNPAHEYRGTWTEVGCALGLDKRVFIFIPNLHENACASNVFCYHENVCVFENMETLKARLHTHFDSTKTTGH